MSGSDAASIAGIDDAVDVVADQDAAQLLEHQDQAEGEQHLVQMVAAVQAADQQPLQHAVPAPRPGTMPSGSADPQTACPLRQREREVGADHVEAAVREVDHAHDAEDQREPARDQEQEQAVLNAIENLDQPFHWRCSGYAKTSRGTIKEAGQAAPRPSVSKRL